MLALVLLLAGVLFGIVSRTGVLAADAATFPQLTLRWIDNSGGVAAFTIERKTGTRGTYVPIAMTGPGVTSYVDLMLAAETTYCYRVRAVDTMQASGYSNEACSVPLPAFASPAVTSWEPGRLDLFMRGPDHTLRHRYFNGTWSEWENLGGYLLSDPGAVSWGSGRIDVFVRGSDNAVWHLYYDEGWGVWESLGGVTFERPAVASWGPGRLDVLVRGMDDQLYHRFYEGSWSAWEPLGGILASEPAVVASDVGRLDVFVRGTDAALYHTFLEGVWHTFASHGGVLTSAPAAMSLPFGRFAVFVRGTDGTLWRQSYDDGRTTNLWDGPGHPVASTPTAVSWSPFRIDLFANRTGTLLHQWSRRGRSASETLDAPP